MHTWTPHCQRTCPIISYFISSQTEYSEGFAVLEALPECLCPLISYLLLGEADSYKAVHTWMPPCQRTCPVTS